MIDEPSKDKLGWGGKRLKDTADIVLRNAELSDVSDEETRNSMRAFADWMIEQSKRPKAERETQREFANRSHIREQRLSDWKNELYFVERLRESLPNAFVDEAPEIYAKIVSRAKMGDPTAMKLYLQQSRLLEAEKHETRSLNVNVDVQGVPRPKA